MRAFAVDGSIWVENSNELQIVALATFVIVGIMSGRNLHSTGTKLHVNKLGILNDGDASTVEGMDEELAVQMLVARILGVDGNGGVTQHGFETSRGDGNLLIGILNGVRERCEGAKLVTSLGILRVALVSLDLKIRPSLQIDVVHLNVRNGRLESTGPVAQSIGTVQQTGLVELIEGLNDGLAAHVVHGESLPRPVDTATQRSELGGNAIAILLLPLPNLLHKLLSAKIVTVLSILLHEHLLHNGLGGNTSMVSTRHVQSGMALHPMPSGQRILHGSRQRMAQMERSGNIGRGDDHDELFIVRPALGGLWIARVVSLGLPPVLPGSLDGVGMIPIVHGSRHVLLLALGGLVNKLLLRGRCRLILGLLCLGLLATASLAPVGLLLLLALYASERASERENMA